MLFIRFTPGYELILKLTDETLHRPGAGFAEGADRASARNVVGNFNQVISILLAALSMRQSVQGLGHPKRAFATRSALAAAFVRVKLRDVGQCLDNIGRVIQHNDRA